MKIIILHGWGHNGDLWANLAQQLGKDSFAIDMPGFGEEPLVQDDWGVPNYAEWVTKKISKHREVILVGHSFGGRIASEIASKNPVWLRALILSGAPCLYRPSLFIKIRIQIYKTSKVFAPRILRSLFYYGDLKKSGEMEKIFRKVVIFDQTNQLRNIKAPTLVIWGGKDKQVPLRIAHEVNSLIRNSELKVIENTGHNTYLENPESFLACVKSFIDKQRS